MRNAARLLFVALLVATLPTRAQVGPATLPAERPIRAKVSRLWQTTCEQSGLAPEWVAGYPLAQATRNGCDIMLMAALEGMGGVKGELPSRVFPPELFNESVGVFNRNPDTQNVAASFGHIACVQQLRLKLMERATVTAEEARALTLAAEDLQAHMRRIRPRLKVVMGGFESERVREWLWVRWEWAEEIKKVASEKTWKEPDYGHPPDN